MLCTSHVTYPYQKGTHMQSTVNWLIWFDFDLRVTRKENRPTSDSRSYANYLCRHAPKVDKDLLAPGPGGWVICTRRCIPWSSRSEAGLEASLGRKSDRTVCLPLDSDVRNAGGWKAKHICICMIAMQPQSLSSHVLMGNVAAIPPINAEHWTQSDVVGFACAHNPKLACTIWWYITFHFCFM